MNKVLSFIILFVILERRLFAAEVGMPQLDPAYWPSQIFWLTIIFLSVYLLIAKIFIPKIEDNIESREDKIRKDLEEAKLLGEESEKKLKTYKDLIKTAKIDTKKIISQSRQKLSQDMQLKGKEIKKEIEKETENAQKEIKNFKINSINKINLISEEIASNLIKDIFGEDPNKSSVKAIVNEIMKGHKF
jgi:F-type H+-transporting ATPase subunit b